MSRDTRRRADLVAGFLEGTYRIEGRLGRGGMGEVFLAFDRRLERHVAIKRLRPDRGQTDSQWQRFLAEARAVAKLNHPAIVHIYELFADGSADCIVMEYVAGATVAELLAASGTLDVTLATSIARQVAEGLAQAHAHDIVHRDLKAENVMVTAAGEAKIVDFGLAKQLATDEPSLTDEGMILGTYRAMSPEQAQGTRVDARSDLFSLGVLLYEMLAGRPPFRGEHPLEILREIVERPVEGIPDHLPDRLADLIRQLLQKDPNRRPTDAGSVVRILDEITASAGFQRQPPVPVKIPPPPLDEAAAMESWIASGDSYGDLPTAPVANGHSAMAASLSDRSNPASRRFHYPLAGLAALIVIGLAFVGIHRGRAEPRRILVLEPVAAASGSESVERLSSAVLMATLDGLAALQGLVPLDPSLLPPGMLEVVETDSSLLAAARTVLADELLSIRLEVQGGTGQVSWRRVDTADGAVLWSQSFRIPSSLTELPLLTDAVHVRLGDAYPEQRPRQQPAAHRHLRAEDHHLFLQAKLRVNSGEVSLVAELERMQALAERSPGFLEVHLLAAQISRILFQDTRDRQYLEGAQRHLEDARRLAPRNPRPLIGEIRRALLLGETHAAVAALTELEQLDPGDPEVLVLSAELARAQGRTPDALASLQAAVERQPTWRNLFLLADLEYQSGRINDARRHFQQILELAPRNLWVQGQLGAMEMQFGDLSRAESIYRELLGIVRYRPYFTNLGLIQFLRGRYEDAVAAYRQALDLEPEHVVVRLNLADATLALGHTAKAEALYLQVLQALEGLPAGKAVDRMNQAQCLVHLGRTREAVEITQKTLHLHPDHPEIVFLASLVYAVAGERVSALVNIASALDKGYQPRWFEIPAFDALRSDPDFEALFTSD